MEVGVDVKEASSPLTPAAEIPVFVDESRDHIEVETEAQVDEYPDPDFLPLPEPIDTFAAPVLSICTQDAVLCSKQDSEYDSSVVSASSIGRATPISLGQTPTPPASPPRQVRVANLQKVNKGLQDQATTSDISVELPSVTERPVHAIAGVGEQEGEDEEDISPPVVDEGSEEITVSVDASLAPATRDEEEENVDSQDEDKIVVLLDKPLVSSPASIVSDLPGSDCEFTFNIETVDVEVPSGSDDEVGVDVVPPSPLERFAPWDYEMDDEKDEDESLQEVDVEVLTPSLGDDVVIYNREEDVVEAILEQEETPRAQAFQMPPDLRVESRSISVSEKPASPTSTITRDVTSTSPPSATLSAPALQPSTSLPGTFPDLAASPVKETEMKPTQESLFSLSQPQLRRRSRTPLEEAIARTRSPLEVALALQLRPGLGSGADPAWMVRFLMAMWGWMFGLVLVPSAEAR
ncbi:hypothetical protein AN958_01020 [Leucoagaricus sp. SymC.cos]|nr:hypothetical protein AN958_01020 [Leucoagaricus sp. SymC.cos]